MLLMVESDEIGKDGKPKYTWVYVYFLLEPDIKERFYIQCNKNSKKKCYTLLSHEKCSTPKFAKMGLPKEICIINCINKSRYVVTCSNFDTGEVIDKTCHTGLETAEWLNERLVEPSRRTFSKICT